MVLSHKEETSRCRMTAIVLCEAAAIPKGDSDVIEPRTSNSIARRTAILCLTMVAIALVALFFRFTADDAFIVARYARNLSSGQGFVFNPQEHVSALTSPAEALVMAAMSFWFPNVMTAYKLVSAALVIGTLLLVARLAFSDLWGVAAFLIATLISPFIAMWTVGGLETPLLLTVVTWLTYMAGLQITRSRLTAVVALSAVAFLVRYDSVLFCAPIVATALRHAFKKKALSPWVLAPMAIPIGWLAFSQWYYGDILPTSFYLKTPTLNPLRLAYNAAYLLSALALSGAGFALIWRWLSERRALTSRVQGATRPAGGVYVGLGLTLLYGLSMSTVHMMFGYRMIVPYLPTALILILRKEHLAPFSRRSLVACLTATQCLMVAVVWWFTVNPTLGTPWGLYEYSRLSLKSYSADFLAALDADASAVRKHWQTAGREYGRQPRVLTYAAGRLPFILRGAYIFEGLISYRKRCRLDWPRYADYVEILYPRNGTREQQLGNVLKTGALISSRQVGFDGRKEWFEVWFNPNPVDNVISRRVSDPCAAADE